MAHLVGVDLRLADLTGANLQQANLEGAAMDKAKLVNANLAGANLNGAILIAANFDQAILAEKILVEDEGETESLEGASEVILIATLSGASLSYATFSNTCMAGVLFTGANLKWADLSEVIFKGSTSSVGVSTMTVCDNIQNRARFDGALCNEETAWPKLSPYACADSLSNETGETDGFDYCTKARARASLAQADAEIECIIVETLQIKR
jgi:uncharacterized protein YjbI with pentapeptide repeats